LSLDELEEGVPVGSVESERDVVVAVVDDGRRSAASKAS